MFLDDPRFEASARELMDKYLIHNPDPDVVLRAYYSNVRFRRLKKLFGVRDLEERDLFRKSYDFNNFAIIPHKIQVQHRYVKQYQEEGILVEKIAFTIDEDKGYLVNPSNFPGHKLIGFNTAAIIKALYDYSDDIFRIHDPMRPVYRGYIPYSRFEWGENVPIFMIENDLECRMTTLEILAPYGSNIRKGLRLLAGWKEGMSLDACLND